MESRNLTAMKNFLSLDNSVSNEECHDLKLSEDAVDEGHDLTTDIETAQVI